MSQKMWKSEAQKLFQYDLKFQAKELIEMRGELMVAKSHTQEAYEVCPEKSLTIFNITRMLCKTSR